MFRRIEKLAFEFSISNNTLRSFSRGADKYAIGIIVAVLLFVSVLVFNYYLQNGLGIKYNDARSHLDMGRRVVEGLTPGMAQLGSVWLPMPHFLMIPTIWVNYFWHSGLAGALQSMLAFVAVAFLIHQYLKKLNVGLLGRLFGIAIFVFNLNILYLQSTAMTELLLLASMTAGAYYLMLWSKDDNLLDLLKSAFWIMISTLVRYDGWFLFLFAILIIIVNTTRKKDVKTTEGTVILFATLGGFGIFLWFLWNLLIFGDPLYFAFGPFSAHAQQTQILEAGKLFTKGELIRSLTTYVYALFYDAYTLIPIIGLIGAIVFWTNKKISGYVKIASLALLAPFFFNVIALYLGHSILFVHDYLNDSWFNVRYGVMLMPAFAIFGGFLIDKAKDFRYILIGLFVLITFFSIVNKDAATIDDALIGASGRNVEEVSDWLQENAADDEGFILIAVSVQDAIVFSSELPMKRFIHEGTGEYWELATGNSQEWATWIIMRTYDINDLAYQGVKDTDWELYYDMIEHHEFADIYQLKPQYRKNVKTLSNYELPVSNKSLKAKVFK